MTCRLPLFAVLTLVQTSCAPACATIEEPLTLEVDLSEPDVPVFDWSGEPLRELQLLRCDVLPCPPWPSDRAEPDAPEGFTTLWHLLALRGVESGVGGLDPPIRYAEPPLPEADVVRAEADTLADGDYVVVGYRLYGRGLAACHSFDIVELEVSAP